MGRCQKETLGGEVMDEDVEQGGIVFFTTFHSLFHALSRKEPKK